MIIFQTHKSTKWPHACSLYTDGYNYVLLFFVDSHRSWLLVRGSDNCFLYWLIFSTIHTGTLVGYFVVIYVTFVHGDDDW